jgi:hypothetical protein
MATLSNSSTVKVSYLYLAEVIEIIIKNEETKQTRAIEFNASRKGPIPYEKLGVELTEEDKKTISDLVNKKRVKAVCSITEQDDTFEVVDTCLQTAVPLIKAHFEHGGSIEELKDKNDALSHLFDLIRYVDTMKGRKSVLCDSSASDTKREEEPALPQSPKRMRSD